DIGVQSEGADVPSRDTQGNQPIVTLGGESDADGRFRFEGLPAGRYVVGFQPGDPVTADVSVGESTELLLRMRRAPAGHCRVRDAAGPLEGAGVYSSLQVTRVGWIDDAECWTPASGQCDLSLRGPGHYRVQAGQGEDWLPAQEIDVQWDDVRQLDF